MKATLIYDSTDATNLADPVTIDSIRGDMCVVYDVSGSTADAINVVLGKRLDKDSPFDGVAYIVTNWHYLDTLVASYTANTGGIFRFEGNYNKFVGYVSGNGTNKRVRSQILNQRSY